MRLMRQKERNRNWRRCFLLYTALLVFCQLSAFPLSMHPHPACPLLELALCVVCWVSWYGCFVMLSTVREQPPLRVPSWSLHESMFAQQVFGLRCKCHIIALMGRFGLSSSSTKLFRKKQRTWKSVSSTQEGRKLAPAWRHFMLKSLARDLRDKVREYYDDFTSSWEVYPEHGTPGSFLLKAGVPRGELNVDTDCSGAEGPFWGG